jgi:small subunit ribosomal protein S9
MATSTLAATGRRKNATARARMTPGEGRMTVNGRAFEEYFPTATQQAIVMAPLSATGTVQKFDIDISASGGGMAGQVGAVRMAIARALLQLDSELRPTLKQAGFLTRDPRMKERKKSGQPGARKRFQFSKR